MSTASPDFNSSYPSRWSWYLPGSQKPSYDSLGDVLLILNRRITPSALGHDAGTEPNKKDEHEGMRPEGLDRPSSEGSLIESPVPCGTQEIEAKVSSKHLSMASRVFRAMFDGKFQESVVPGCNQLSRVPLPEDDADAMMVLLGIIHGLNRSVPRTIDYALFFAIVVLIDKYELQEVTGVYTDLWFPSLWPHRDTSTPHIADWIYICWVLKRPPEYNELTRKAIFACHSRFDDNGLPLPPAISKDLLTYLNKTLETYQGEIQQCSQNTNCDALVLGDLVRKLKAKGLYPVPQAAALDVSLWELFSQLLELAVSTLCEIQSPPHTQSSFGIAPAPPVCGIEKSLKEKIFRLRGGVAGLTLPIYTPSNLWTGNKK
ncbi:hypothetical protein AYO21_01187 [Fonsecaea monophora]|uniref:BTB domain-containing protein n=1 Tax=Fonsecaea monophora TaxID=254056 RepID=A0A177FKH7_9EURO|nr:hypothetical protein AYO21_01187 [Fonsecaea monophora]OAG44697.1 hypothetical protein AYO21_01187 [Fonsecaea monophora]